MLLTVIAIGAFVSTLLGGFFALRFKDRLHLILGWSAGAVIGAAFFDLLPEALTLGSKYHNTSLITSIVALGFIFYMIIDRLMVFHSHHHEHEKQITSTARGKMSAGSLSIHSFLDGIAVGIAFQVSATIGTIVAVAVLAHDFSDGINTVNMIIKNNGSRTEAFRWLLADALAPVLGVASTIFFSLPESTLSLMLATFTGFFLYIGASDLLPESHHAHPTLWTTTMTVLGVAVLYVVIKLATI